MIFPDFLNASARVPTINIKKKKKKKELPGKPGKNR
jgi:hypothetical protein